MKMRNGFVSNSSSTSFIITNKTDKVLPWSDFVKENAHLVEWFVRRYGDYDSRIHSFRLGNQDKVGDNCLHSKVICIFDDGEPVRVDCGKLVQFMCDECSCAEPLHPGETLATFGDEDGTIIGLIYDYSLRKGGESEHFNWRFNEWLR